MREMNFYPTHLVLQGGVSSKMDLFAGFFIVVRTPSMQSTLWTNLQVHCTVLLTLGTML